MKRIISTFIALSILLIGCSSVEKSVKLEEVPRSSSEAILSASGEEDKLLPEGSTFEVRYLDVGQADAALVSCDGKFMLIDGGNVEDSSLIVAVLKKLGVSHLDYVINTHPHEDHVEGLAGSRDLGAYISNLVRADFDGGEARKNITSTLSLLRQQYFNEAAQKIKAQDRKIDEIYQMCEDMYGLARMNKVLGLESKAENMMSSLFILQRQQSELKGLLGVDNLNTPYLSDRLLNEKDKADKVLAFSLEVYEAMIAEVKSSLFKPAEVIAQAQTVAMPVKTEAKQVESPTVAADDFVDLVEKPKPKGEVTVKPPTGDRAEAMKRMLKGI